MDGVKGTCGLCGGRVIGHAGVWMAVTPPPPGVCESCGAIEAANGPVLDMVPRRAQPTRQVLSGQPYVRSDSPSDCGCSGGCKAWDCKNL
jgi:hypothetical protein